ncbi:SMI1/KNR4 family protein [Radiobacillus kanasensis]|uniref:SMI1/KNR4 family protein n=1 Tax=Radiobacillus kanasensis TaxID=2844358 RepID=UPI001E3D0F84|nr:SMI1/KNR4 family protein [Radiobacillus kanasensis]UFU00183.1 SMI1/KNR4 family protein [Radiobacillus kanasensis]
MAELIHLTLNGIKERLKSINSIQIQREQGFTLPITFDLNVPASEKDIVELESSLNITLPIDYKRFLEEHDGAHIFKNIYGGGFQFYSVNEIQTLKKPTYLKSNWIVIGYSETMYLIIDNSRVREGNPNYLLLLDGIFPEDIIDLKSNFEIWFDRYIVAQGSYFWNWYNVDASNYYKKEK